MKEALVSKGPKVQIVDSPIPTPNPDQVLIKVIVSGSNPKDWKVPVWFGSTANEGDDIAGIVEAVGANVFEFAPGDRVAAFHEMRTPHGSYAEYALAWQHTTFHIPPWSPPSSSPSPTPLIIYGASSAVGTYALQLARRTAIHPILCIAGRAQDRVLPLLTPSNGDALLDCRDGDAALVSSLVKAVDTLNLPADVPIAVLDAVSTDASVANVGEFFRQTSRKGSVTFVLPGEKAGLPEGVEQTTTNVGCVHREDKDFGYVYFRYFARGLAEGWFRGQKTEVVPGGLAGVEGALKKLMSGEASAVKYVFRIGETEGVVR
ncbi:chaperonin 10-like protein [Staphylotrichum tortipilum]|uniref:Chaperonin 10-like protein n=1 Tax=Staphylotrichum tortipilum TaxID=2831512 RepID=A0AAN6MKK4_9PEZI|nr:chaperonin 10-like protein [Staphylotrichum longicolle]